MRKVKFIVMALAALFIVSCSQSKEDKFISSFEEFVEQIEKMSNSEFMENRNMIGDQFSSKMETLYGVKMSSMENIVESAEAAGLSLNQEQKEKLLELETRLMKKVAELTKSDNGQEESEDTELSSIDTELSSTDTESTEDFDAVLESYEEYVDQYISYMKKAANGDMEALSEYPALMEKAQELSKNLEKAKGDLSASQLAKYQKINMKMLEAAQNMQ